ncbi:MAG: DUF5018 domain-containing protein [Proteiniphilum sp.]|nr:DUF5018 domain-containing protein [Proteiniphilum sp.]MDD4799611.1 DUF5018 domain-containing protein [Proteiniphilum sp.]
MNIRTIISIGLFLCMGSWLCSCEEKEMDESLPINPVLNPILSVTAQDGNQIATAVISNNDLTIHLELANLRAEERKAVPVKIHISKRAKLIAPTDTVLTLDLTQPHLITINNLYKDVTYTLTASAPFRIELWRKTATELAFVKHNNGAIAFSGDYLVVHERTKFDYYKLKDGAKAGTLSFEGIDWDTLTRTVPLFMAGDEAGNIVACNFYMSRWMPAGGTNTIHMFWWEGVAAKPKLLFSYDVEIDKPGNIDVGRKIYVRGDMTKHAFLYMGVSFQNMFLRWEIQNGQVVSAQPDKIEYDPGYQMGTQPTIVPATLGKNANYFIARYEDGAGKVAITYMDGTTHQPIYASEHHIQNIFHQWLGGGHAFDYVPINGKHYIFMIEQKAESWMREVFDVKKVIEAPNSIGSIMDLIHTRKWNDWLDFPIDPLYGKNSNNTGDVVARVSPDGKTATVAFLCTNSGVIVWEINTE